MVCIFLCLVISYDQYKWLYCFLSASTDTENKEQTDSGLVAWWKQLFTMTDLVFQAIGVLLVTMMVVMLFQIGWEYKISANLKDSIEKMYVLANIIVSKHGQHFTPVTTATGTFFC